ncbi:MAG: tetratricopeptide repeat-containing S1 family peptidase [Planctomycetota bacterium]
MEQNLSEEALKALTERVSPSVVSVVPHDADFGALPEGSGFFIGEGRLITARHLFHEARAARVMLQDGSVHDVLGILAEDRDADVLMLAVDIADGTVPPLRLSDGPSHENEEVVCFSGRLSPGAPYVGSTTRVKEFPYLGQVILHTCEPHAEESGGPLVTSDGNVVGMNVVMDDDDGDSLAYAVPPDRIDALSAEEFVRLADRSTDPTAPSAYLPGVQAILERDYDTALAAFHDVVGEDAGNAQAWAASAEVLMRLGRSTEAVKAARSAIEIEPESPAYWALLAQACQSEGNPQDAVEACRRLARLRPNDPHSHNRLGVSLFNMGLYRDAAESFCNAIRLNPEDAQEHKNLGVASFAMGNFQEAVESFREAVRLRPEFDRAWKNLGMSYYNLGQYERAVEASLEAIKLRPDFARAHNNLGVAYQALGRTLDAIDCYREAVRLKPRFSQAYANLAYALLKTGKKEEAVEAYRDAIRQNPSDSEAHAQLGVLYRGLGRSKEAQRSFEQAIRQNPKHAGAHFHLGMLYVEIGNKGGALDEYKVLKEIDRKTAERLFEVIYK